MFQLQLFFLLHCDEWDRVVALPRHKFVTGATLLQLIIVVTRELRTYNIVLLSYKIVQLKYIYKR